MAFAFSQYCHPLPTTSLQSPMERNGIGEVVVRWSLVEGLALRAVSEAVLAASPLLPHSWGASPPAPGPSMRGARMVQGSCCHSTSVCRVLSQGDCVLVFTHLKQPVRSKYYLHTCFEHTDSRPSYTCSSFLAPAAVTHFLAISSCPLRRGRTRWVVFLVFTSSTRLILACIMAQSWIKGGGWWEQTGNEAMPEVRRATCSGAGRKQACVCVCVYLGGY